MPSSDAEKYVKERFGLELEGEFYYNGDYWYCREPGEEFETNGIRAIRDMKIGLKPTTYFLQLTGPRINKNKIKLSKLELEALLKGEMIERKMSDADCSCQKSGESNSSWKCCGKGYVALFYKDRCIGCGLYKDNLVSGRIPKGRAQEFIDLL